MTNEEKLEYIAESVEMEVDELQPDTVLEDLETWDSVAVLSIIAVMNEQFNRFPSAEDVLQYKTVKELMDAMEE